VPQLSTYYSPDYSYQTFQTTVSFTWPTTDPFGTDLHYYVVAKADVGNQVAEGNEADNWGVSNVIQILKPDLAAVALRAPSTVQAGQQLTARLDVQNAGALQAEASTGARLAIRRQRLRKRRRHRVVAAVGRGRSRDLRRRNVIHRRYRAVAQH